MNSTCRRGFSSSFSIIQVCSSGVSVKQTAFCVAYGSRSGKCMAGPNGERASTASFPAMESKLARGGHTADGVAGQVHQKGRQVGASVQQFLNRGGYASHTAAPVR